MFFTRTPWKVTPALRVFQRGAIHKQAPEPVLQDRSKPTIILLWEQGLYCDLWQATPVMWAFIHKATSLENGGWATTKQNPTMLSYWILPTFSTLSTSMVVVSFWLISRVQKSWFWEFCPLTCCLSGEMNPWSSLLCHSRWHRFFWVRFDWLIVFLMMGHVFLSYFMPSNVWMPESVNFSFLVLDIFMLTCFKFLAVKLLENSVSLSGLTFMIC